MNKENKELWESAIGINESDGVEPSEKLKELINMNIKGQITTDEMIERLKECYEEENN